MPPLRQPTHRSLRHCYQSSFWLLGLSWIGVMAILSSVATAQTLTEAEAAALEDAPVEAPAAISPAAEPPAAEPELSLPQAEPTVPASPSASQPAPDLNQAQVDLPPDNNYIDTTPYNLGATERTAPATPQTPVVRVPELPTVDGGYASATPVNVGPLSLSASGISLGIPSIRDYYNRSLRPPARLGNGNISLIFPLSIPAPLTSLFGWRIHPITGTFRFHSGTDLGAPLGTPVVAAYAGRVAIADFLGGYGLTVTVEHNKGTQETLYAHLSEIFVKPGEWVDQGAVIGRVGSTGNSTGPHLHFEFRQMTSQGWVTLDTGAQLEYALAQLAKGMRTAELPLGLQARFGVSSSLPDSTDQSLRG